MEGDATMSSQGLAHSSEIDHEAYASSTKASNKGKGREQQGIRVVTQPEQFATPKQARDNECDVTEPRRASQHWQAGSAKADLQAMQEYVSQLPDALVSELAVMLAQRMKQQIRNSDKSSSQHQGGARGPAAAEGGSSPVVVVAVANAQAREHAGRLLGRLERGEGAGAALRYIVTPHLSLAGASIRHRIGEAEMIPCLAPGLYRENGDGGMVLETSFRRSWVVESGGGEGEGEGGGASMDNAAVVTTRPVAAAGEQGRLRKMMSRVFKKQGQV